MRIMNSITPFRLLDELGLDMETGTRHASIFGPRPLLLNIVTGDLNTLKFPVNIVPVKRVIRGAHQIDDPTGVWVVRASGDPRLYRM